MIAFYEGVVIESSIFIIVYWQVSTSKKQNIFTISKHINKKEEIIIHLLKDILVVWLIFIIIQSCQSSTASQIALNPVNWKSESQTKPLCSLRWWWIHNISLQQTRKRLKHSQGNTPHSLLLNFWPAFWTYLYISSHSHIQSNSQPPHMDGWHKIL